MEDQILKLIQDIGNNGENIGPEQELLAVSYTHLDVYKRQIKVPSKSKRTSFFILSSPKIFSP